MRVFLIFTFLFLHQTGCAKQGINPPPNADQNEKSSIQILLGKAEYAGWNKEGRLEILSLVGRYVNDKDLIHVANLRDLCELGLMGTSVTDEGLMLLKNNYKLRALSLQYSERITNNGLKVINFLPEITILDLAHNSFDDSSVGYLVQVKGLSHLFLRGSGLTQEGMAQLRARLPKCHIQTE